MHMNNRKWGMDLLVILLGVLLDQMTKYLAVVYLKGQEAISLIPGVLELRYLENRGAAFGILQGGKVIFLIITPIVLLVAAYVLVRMPDGGKYGILHFLLDCIIIGAVGNLIDRIRLDYVVDFIYIRLIDFPIFNVADMFVSIATVVGAVLLLFGHSYRNEDFSFLSLKKRKPEEEEKNG
ncbi:MAG TPA: signal peptidase II [Candidatus Eisenbergiella stercoravium]|nr:signal peptidase II [Candidatus Eisenbergiella stercoravium]